MLDKCIISTILWWRSKEIPTPLIMAKRFSIPILNGVWRICKHHIELLHSTILGKGRTLEGIVIHNREIMNAMQIQIHAGNG